MYTSTVYNSNRSVVASGPVRDRSSIIRLLACWETSGNRDFFPTESWGDLSFLPAHVPSENWSWLFRESPSLRSNKLVSIQKGSDVGRDSKTHRQSPPRQ